MQVRTATVDGVPMRWVEHGSGVPVVLLHGIPTSPLLFRYVLPLLDGVHALAWEMVGYGESIPAGADRPIALRTQADYLIAWLDHLRVDRVVLVGHDLGGGVAHIAALSRPERCAGLVLTNAVGYDSWPIPEVKLLRALGGLVRYLPLGALRMLFWMLMRRGHDDQSRATESIDVHLARYRLHGGAAAFVRQIRSLDVRDTLDVSPQLSRLNVPARIVWGAADQFQKLRYGERFARDLRAPLDRIDGGKHFTPEDHPRAVADAIREVAARAREY